MKVLTCVAAIALLAGCRTGAPVKHAAGPVETLVQKTGGPVGFQDADLADSIIFLVVKINLGWKPPNESIGLIQKPDPEEEQEQAKFARLREVCRGKRVTLEVDYCPTLALLSFLTKCAGVDYEFKNDKVVIILSSGEVLGDPDSRVAPHAGKDIR